MAQLGTVWATIAAGQSLSAGVNCTAGRPVRVLMPDEWDDANLTFQVSVDGTDFYDLYDFNGSEVTLNCDGGLRAVVLPDNAAIAVAYLKIRSGSTLVPVPQKAERRFRITMDNTVVV